MWAGQEGTIDKMISLGTRWNRSGDPIAVDGSIGLRWIIVHFGSCNRANRSVKQTGGGGSSRDRGDEKKTHGSLLSGLFMHCDPNETGRVACPPVHWRQYRSLCVFVFV